MDEALYSLPAHFGKDEVPGPAADLFAVELDSVGSRARHGVIQRLGSNGARRAPVQLEQVLVYARRDVLRRELGLDVAQGRVQRAAREGAQAQRGRGAVVVVVFLVVDAAARVVVPTDRESAGLVQRACGAAAAGRSDVIVAARATEILEGHGGLYLCMGAGGRAGRAGRGAGCGDGGREAGPENKGVIHIRHQAPRNQMTWRDRASSGHKNDPDSTSTSHTT